mmetsp:Transcript_14270/g.26673  ORF Transcript_14270/g.26673 Transcript_14270/m.26673 type:complete len:81 (+) Transcript_14270:141-383(+)
MLALACACFRFGSTSSFQVATSTSFDLQSHVAGDSARRPVVSMHCLESIDAEDDVRPSAPLASCVLDSLGLLRADRNLRA